MATGMVVPAPPTISMVSCACATPMGTNAKRPSASRRMRRFIAKETVTAGLRKPMRRSMRAHRSGETESLRDALADAPGFVAVGIRAEIDAIKPARLPDLRFDR